MNTNVADEHRLQNILASDAFRVLHRRRSRLAWTLTAVMLAIYFGFIALVAFAPTVLAIKVGDGATSWGIPAGLGVIFSAILLTGLYVWRANASFDALTADALRAAE